MKKIGLALLCIGGLLLSLTGCGSGEAQNNGQGGAASGTESFSPEVPAASPSADTVQSSSTQEEAQAGWSAEMQGVRTAVTEVLGDNYWPDMEMTPDMLESFFGITADMYEDYLAETPMISVNVDTLVVILPREGQEEAVEQALNAYRDSQINDAMQYPMNLAKVQASRVDRAGSYVCFVQLGADTPEDDEEAAIAQCQETNELVLEIIGQQTRQ